jgi:hypothetical protein
LNEEYNVGSPHAKRDSYDNPILVPNGDSGGVYEFRKDCPRKKRTFGVRSTAKRKRVLNKLRSKEKEKKNGAQSFILKDWDVVGCIQTGNAS